MYKAVYLSIDPYGTFPTPLDAMIALDRKWDRDLNLLQYNPRQKGNVIMQAVRIERNLDGTYSAYIFGRCICTGTNDECISALRANGEIV